MMPLSQKRSIREFLIQCEKGIYDTAYTGDIIYTVQVYVS